MADASVILSGNGIQNVAPIIAAARMEGMDLAVAATLVAGESWGRHIWGHDAVSTGGAYVKGGAVTKSNYLAYRNLMRAGRIGRQGVGICQCTSAQYQDTADQLGGAWDMLANCRSGFRGAQSLIRAYGLRGGMRRYNGSGSAAERYADAFMARYATWSGRLSGASVSTPDVALPPVPTPARPKELPLMIERALSKGLNEGRMVCPTGSASSLVEASWVSVSLAGGGRVQLWFQKGARSSAAPPGAGAPVDWTIWNAERPWVAVPSGTEFLEYRITANGAGSLLVEQKPR